MTADFGGGVGWMQDRYSLGYSGWPSQISGSKVRGGWLLPVGEFLSELGRDWQRQEREGVGGGGSGNVSSGSAWPRASNVQLVNAACAG